MEDYSSWRVASAVQSETPITSFTIAMERPVAPRRFAWRMILCLLIGGKSAVSCAKRSKEIAPAHSA